LTLALDGAKWSASCPGHYIPRARASGTHWIGSCVGPRAGLDEGVKRKIPLPGIKLPIIQQINHLTYDSRPICLKLPQSFFFLSCWGVVQNQHLIQWVSPHEFDSQRVTKTTHLHKDLLPCLLITNSMEHSPL